MKSYNSPIGAEQYISFINSDSGKFEQKILPSYIIPALPKNPNHKILDAGCGTGWLTNVLNKQYIAQGCDASQELINYAKKTYPNNTFQVCDVTQPNVPFAQKSFDAIVANLSLHDMANVPQALKNFNHILNIHGTLIVTISNPYYSLPVGVWKRGILGRVLGKKPWLRVRSYFSFKKTDRSFTWGDHITSHFYTLPEYIEWAHANGFQLISLQDIQSSTDSPDFNLQYQLFRFPYIIMLVFEKTSAADAAAYSSDETTIHHL